MKLLRQKGLCWSVNYSRFFSYQTGSNCDGGRFIRVLVATGKLAGGAPRRIRMLSVPAPAAAVWMVTSWVGGISLCELPWTVGDELYLQSIGSITWLRVGDPKLLIIHILCRLESVSYLHCRLFSLDLHVMYSWWCVDQHMQWWCCYRHFLYFYDIYICICAHIHNT